MKKKHKINQIIAGIDLLILGAAVLLFTLGLVLAPEDGGLIKSPWFGTISFNTIVFKSVLGNVVFAILMAAIPIIAVEGGILNIRQGLNMRKQSVKSDKSFWAKLGTLDFYLDIFNNLLFLIVFLALFTIILHIFLYQTREFTYRFILYAGTLAVYIILRKWLADRFRKFRKTLRKGNPTYSLTEDGVSIKLVTKADKNRPDPPPVLIRFDEIEELKAFTYAEAEAYLKYQVGPDINLGINQTKDYVRYLKGEIPRPSVFTLSSYGTGSDKRVLLKGPALFYLITFDTDDITDLFAAYTNFKNSKTSTGTEK